MHAWVKSSGCPARHALCSAQDPLTAAAAGPALATPDSLRKELALVQAISLAARSAGGGGSTAGAADRPGDVLQLLIATCERLLALLSHPPSPAVNSLVAPLIAARRGCSTLSSEHGRMLVHSRGASHDRLADAILGCTVGCQQPQSGSVYTVHCQQPRLTQSILPECAAHFEAAIRLAEALYSNAELAKWLERIVAALAAACVRLQQQEHQPPASRSHTEGAAPGALFGSSSSTGETSALLLRDQQPF